jgi:hypothetical protein
VRLKKADISRTLLYRAHSVIRNTAQRYRTGDEHKKRKEKKRKKNNDIKRTREILFSIHF